MKSPTKNKTKIIEPKTPATAAKDPDEPNNVIANMNIKKQIFDDS